MVEDAKRVRFIRSMLCGTFSQWIQSAYWHSWIFRKA